DRHDVRTDPDHHVAPEPAAHRRDRRPGAPSAPARPPHHRDDAGAAEPAAGPAPPALAGRPDAAGTAGRLRPRRPHHARDLPVRRHVPGDQHRDAARAHLGHARATAHHSPRPAGPAARLRGGLRPGRGTAGRGHGGGGDHRLRPGGGRVGVAGGPHRRRRRDPRRGPRAPRQRLRPQRVPGGAVHAGDRAAAVLPVRAAGPPRADGRLAAGHQRRPPPDLRGRGPPGGRQLRDGDGHHVAGRRDRRRRRPARPRARGGDPAEEDQL
ncbi:MAG: Efflux ABC transporter, permease protein, partial [uncultured Blastococcus sp.]